MKIENWKLKIGTGLAGLLAGVVTGHAAATNPPAAKAAASPAPAQSPPAAAPAAAPIPRSVFTLPRTPPQDGVDPFYPQSTRFASVAASTAATNPAPARAELVIKGFSGTAARPLVVINDKNFAVQDQFEVSTPQGKVRVRCLEIRANAAAVVEVNGERRELTFRPPK